MVFFEYTRHEGFKKIKTKLIYPQSLQTMSRKSYFSHESTPNCFFSCRLPITIESRYWPRSFCPFIF